MQEKTERKQHMTRADVILFLLCLLTAAVFAVWFAAGRRAGGTLRLTCDGEVIFQSTLQKLEKKEEQDAASESVRYCLLLYTEEGVSCAWYEIMPDLAAEVPAGSSYNLLSVSESGVSMEAADCPDQICVYHIPIKSGGESIICLPHKLAVEILGETEEGRHGHETDG